jgi:hypothetical protein
MPWLWRGKERKDASARVALLVELKEREKEGDEHVVSQDLPVSLGSSLSETFSTWTLKGEGEGRSAKGWRKEGAKRGEVVRTFSSSGHVVLLSELLL